MHYLTDERLIITKHLFLLRFILAMELPNRLASSKKQGEMTNYMMSDPSISSHFFGYD